MRISDWSSDVCSSYLHLFDAADSTFAIALTGQETIELRRWVIGPEGSSRGRRRGLAARLSDVASYAEEGARAIEPARNARSAEHTSELQYLMRTSSAVFCLQKNTLISHHTKNEHTIRLTFPLMACKHQQQQQKRRLH